MNFSRWLLWHTIPSRIINDFMLRETILLFAYNHFGVSIY